MTSAGSDQSSSQSTEQQAVERLQQQFQTLLLSTEYQGRPELSYAPFSRDDQGRFYILISELAEHCRNLLHNPNCSVLFIADERDSRNLFARERLSFYCQAEQVERDSQEYGQQLQQLEQKFGSVIGVLRGLADFHLLRLTPFRGRYVVGFGKAFDIDPHSGRIDPVTPEGPPQ